LLNMIIIDIIENEPVNAPCKAVRPPKKRKDNVPS
jgi:hypothetical protein